MLAAHLKGVRKGTLIDDSLRPEENYIRRRFLSDEGAAFTLPLAPMVNKSPAVFIFIREIDDLQRENRSTISKEKVEGL